MDSCDTAIESLRCKLFADKRFGYHHGTQRVLTSHEKVHADIVGLFISQLQGAFEVFWVP